MDKYEGLFLMKLDFALKLLPNVKPKIAKALLNGIFFDLVMRYSSLDEDMDLSEEDFEIQKAALATRVGGIDLKLDSFHGIFFSREPDRITPEGARLLLDLYYADTFELKSKKAGIGSAAALEEYAKSRDLILQRQADQATAAEIAMARHIRLVQNPSEVKESDFTPKILGDIFWAHVGAGGGTLEIGGVKVSKTIHRTSSNIGKTKDWCVSYNWTGSDGKEQTLGRPSSFENNRRNDPGRNWGLPE
jgi:hypothetical protein